MDFWKQVFDLAESTAQRVGQQLLQDFGHATAQTKADGSLVTQSDRWADAEIKKTITAAFPDHAVLSEEDFHLFTDTPWTWVIDPIDGTTNFTRGIPLWGVSIGLLYQGQPVFGYIFFPPVQQTFYGYWPGATGLEMPSGAWFNGQPIQSSPDQPTSNHLFGLCARSSSVLKNKLPAKIRMIGVTTYSFSAVAAGLMIGAVESTPKIWDLAAVWPILHAAGGHWISLSADPIFPAQVGKDYGSYPLPSLLLARLELAPMFEPLIRDGLGK
jgi:myo-inositol-1(or 4)-monophosphatase